VQGLTPTIYHQETRNMNQRLTDDFYALNRFRDRLARATSACETTDLVLDVPATVRRMAARENTPKLVVLTVPGSDFLTVRYGQQAHFNVQMIPGRSPSVSLVRDSIDA
jgi:hypothetical protein